MSEEFALDAQRMEVLSALCDTIVPSIEHRPDPHGHWARSASAYGVPQALADAMATFPPDVRGRAAIGVKRAGTIAAGSQSSRNRRSSERIGPLSPTGRSPRGLPERGYSLAQMFEPASQPAHRDAA